jgi:uncharacterized LabA/DUF88 family protein
MIKTRIFIDFWNFQLSLNDVAGKTYRADWNKLSPWLIAQAQAIIGFPLQYEGTTVYLSYDPRRPEDKSLRNWANNFLDHLPGVNIVMQERKPKNPPICPSCHVSIDKCPHCGASTAGTVEKGVDTAMVTDLLALAWANAWEVAILLSSDRDFIPAINLLAQKGFHVINAHFPPIGAELSKTCWASIDLQKALKVIDRT